VSIVIPCYNGELFVKKSIESALEQTYKKIELIIVNDGSKDKTYDEINSCKNESVTIINKPNTGVSDSRNIGMQHVTGEYILFLDADDVLEPDFLEKRVEILEKDKSLDFCTGEIIWIDENDQLIKMPKKQFGIYENTVLNVAAFNPVFSTCPSAYLFRFSTIKKKHVLFNTKISSPADRYFILELGYGAKGDYVKQGGKLLYRINTHSMSHLFSKKLIFDQENYFYEVLKHNLLRPHEKAILIKKMSYQMFASFFKLKMYKSSLFYLSKYLKSFFL
jgi:glycosyltransferase involved in cell wall biosynthesis